MANLLWFGTTNKMMSLPIPSSGMGANKVGYSEELMFENGGMDVYRPSNSYHMEYEFDFGIYEATGVNGLNNYSDFSAGLYGSPTVFFSDPMFYDVNLFPPNFGAPALSEVGWKSVGGGALVPTYSNTAANSYSQPARSVTYTTTSLAANTFVSNEYAVAVIPVPPGMALWLGVSGSSTGNGVVRTEMWMNGAASPATTANMTLLSPTAATRLNMSISYTAANYVKVGLASSASGAGTVSLTSMVAQLWPSGVTPATSGSFVSGQGNNGCKFSSDAVEESYIIRDSQGRNVHYLGMSFTLKEVVR